MGVRQSKHSGSDPETITRQALGRVASLGDLYDATVDKFCGVHIPRTVASKFSSYIYNG